MIEKIIEFVALVLALTGAPEPLLLTGYDVAQGGINCVDPCTQTALGYWLDDQDYWNGATGLAACPTEWLGATLIVEGFGTLRCLDTGGAIKRYQWNEYYETYVTHVDVLAVAPTKQPWNYQIFKVWYLDWP